MRHLLWFDVAFYMAAGVFLALHSQRSLHYFVGMAMAVIFMACWIAARVQLGRSFSVAARATQLVTTGFYSKIRNPIYFFGHLSMLGLIIASGFWILLLFWLGGIPFQFLRARKESQVLEAAYGDEYRRYKASTWF